LINIRLARIWNIPNNRIFFDELIPGFQRRQLFGYNILAIKSIFLGRGSRRHARSAIKLLNRSQLIPDIGIAPQSEGALALLIKVHHSYLTVYHKFAIGYSLIHL
jgi:hypothetical protein